MQATLASASSVAEPRPAPDRLALLLARTSFGIREEELDAARSVGEVAWLERQLAPETIAEPAIDAALARNFPGLAMSISELVARGIADGNPQRAVAELRGAVLTRQLFSQRQLFETVVDFWHDHFNTDHLDGPMVYFKIAEDRDLRAHAFGRFGDLLLAVTRSPAMLHYLDNASSVVDAPNENFARELLELHTLGVDGGYGEQDVREVARILTGWTIIGGPRGGGGDVRFGFVAQLHDYGAKRVLGVDFPAGIGQAEGVRLLALLAAHPSTARRVATKLVRRFVDDAPPAALVDRIAAEFLANGGEIRPLLRSILRSAEFAASADRKLRRPMDYVLAAVRTVATIGNGPAALRGIAEQLQALGQLHFMWPAPNGYPDVAGYWVNTSSMLARWNFAFALSEDRHAGLSLDTRLLFGKARSAEELLDRLIARVLRRTLAPGDRAALLALPGAVPKTTIDATTRDALGRAYVAALLASDSFQLR